VFALLDDIDKGKLEKICESYMLNRGARDVIAFLSPYGITANKAIRFYKEYGNKAIETVKDHPYKLCEISGIGFLTADKIALSMGMHPLDPRRVDEGLLFTLVDAEGRGHLCLEKHAFIKAALKLMDTDGLTEDMAACRAMALVNQGQLVCYGGDVFRSKTAAVEGALARAAIKQINNTPKLSYGDLDAELDKQETVMKLKLAPEQEQDYVFTNETGGMISVYSLTRICSRVEEKYGLRHLKLHGLRHTCGSLMIKNGVDIETVKSVFGHENIRTTQQYLTAYDSAKRNAAELLTNAIIK